MWFLSWDLSANGRELGFEFKDRILESGVESLVFAITLNMENARSDALKTKSCCVYIIKAFHESFVALGGKNRVDPI